MSSVTELRYPRTYAERAPDRPAVMMGDVTVTYGELEAGSNRFANLMYDRGLRPGDHIAVFMENTPQFFEIVWAAAKSGLYYTPISSLLTAGELEYVVNNCEAQVLVVTPKTAEVATQILDQIPAVHSRLVTEREVPGFESYELAVERCSSSPLAEEFEGVDMFYSSGTTGRPKGVKRPFELRPAGVDPMAMGVYLDWYGYREEMMYLSTGPFYHAAPLVACLMTHRVGGTVIAMPKFDERVNLELIERHRVTHTVVVPTMFSRMLKLPESERARFDVSSLEFVVHGAAPCPVSVKEAMIEWWGPVIYEYYAGTEGNVFTFITPDEWLARKGSVGQAKMGVIHIVDDDGHELPVGEAGVIYAHGGYEFEYYNDAEKTESSYDQRGWSTLNDVGYVDEDGYLYLTDRKAFMIISGGVNIYPQEVENLLVTHPKVFDVAVIGVPNEDFGEEVKAVVQLMPDTAPDDATAAELIEFCRAQLAAYKCPRSVDFVSDLPRLPTGKLAKGPLRDTYWAGSTSKLV